MFPCYSKSVFNIDIGIIKCYFYVYCPLRYDVL